MSTFFSIWRVVIAISTSVVVGLLTRNVLMGLIALSIALSPLLGYVNIPDNHARAILRFGHIFKCVRSGHRCYPWPFFTWGPLVDLRYKPVNAYIADASSNTRVPFKAHIHFMHRCIPRAILDRDHLAMLISHGEQGRLAATQDAARTVTLNVIRQHSHNE